MKSDERFRRNFILAMTVVYTIAFIAMIGGFAEALLMAAVFSGVMYPLYRWFETRLGGRSTPALLLTLLTTILAILIPLIVLLGLVAEQAIVVADKAGPWIEQQLSESQVKGVELPAWLPFSGKLEPFREDIIAKLGELAQQTGVFLAASLARLSEGTLVFFFQLFIMLYAMFFFLISGPELIKRMMGYLPLSENDKARMLDVGLSVSRATIKGALLIGIIQGTLAGIGFTVAGIDAAVFYRLGFYHLISLPMTVGVKWPDSALRYQ